ncbi:(E)-4-hydroxy-3-methylbut-2-enyl-diphosphate synthase [Carboxylicivirga linearis]|uniref:4-hydroxy-3-methylbut-2-en-1-yl diphosphate synthase (flavodoxin) n=1 Tax=Carboxylicivirga linearis TaxID=1628157 RepID=A0ABS5JPU6_9BACT|nr:(E)-4-hydroxy-3-methylbut-2-enyl-diphosphate synthase [Carboxylicivirga linearis]MBS2096910.1 (E)-4-hydroxy-3-methylbut-2-enyl-diphosphate synthase [Carboxylicivirga linearis]
MLEEPLYCEDLFNYRRNTTLEVRVGNTTIGGNASIRIQSMTTTNTMDTEATAEQVMSILDEGADIVRITTQGRREAYNLENIKQIIGDKGYKAPIVADIHFNPNAAEIAAEKVEKVRINPGNFAGGAKKFNLIDYTDEEYAKELAGAKSKLKPFLSICKENNTAIRIGTNHGSLSDRIMSRFGDTPQGMVESCLEYLRMCRELDFNDIVLSIKASNTRIMVHTVRLLVASMKKENMNYPLHLGVTEAGSEDEGRIKSAVGSGALLADGLGDTIRVSLTEDPEKEVPVAKKLVDYITNRVGHEIIPSVKVSSYTPFEYNKRKTHSVLNIGDENIAIVIGEKDNEQKVDYLLIDNINEIDQSRSFIIPFSKWTEDLGNQVYPMMAVSEFIDNSNLNVPLFVRLSLPELNDSVIEKLKQNKNVVIMVYSNHKNIPVEQRALIFKLDTLGLTHPIIISNDYSENELEDLQIKSAADCGLLLIDGFADGLLIRNKGAVEQMELTNIAFGILQASRVRFTKTEFISCPGCGRTLFSLQDTTKMIKSKTSHLKGLKIGVMGCIVNGVGEMADADYGYIGSGPGTVSLFKNRELVKRNLPGEKAVDELIKLIKENGDWVDPKG